MRKALEDMTKRLFDPASLAYGLRTALGAVAALWIAWGLGLEHPQWAGMTVWAASQPVRSHLVEKSLFRGAGTVIGAAFGVLLVSAATWAGSPALLVCGIALWLGLCAATGNLLRGFASYGALLAGFTAVMVAVLDSGHSENVLALGLDRTATVLIGVVVALGIGLLLTPRGGRPAFPPVCARRAPSSCARSLPRSALRAAPTGPPSRGRSWSLPRSTMPSTARAPGRSPPGARRTTAAAR